MKQLALTLLTVCFLAMLLTSCGKEANKNKTKIIFQTGAAVDYPAGAIVYAQKQDSEEKLAINVASTPEILLANGNWNFYGVVWSGATGLDGTVSCALTSKNLQGGSTTVDLYLSQAACNDSAYSPSSFLFNNQPFSLSLTSCHDLSTVLSGSSLCTSGNAGVSASYLVSVLDYRGFGFTGVTPQTNPLNSSCITASSLGIETNTGLLIPAGGTHFPFLVRVRAFEGAGCSGTYEDYLFKSGLSQGINGKAKSFAYGSSSLKIYLNHFPSDITAVGWNKTNLITDSASPINLSSFASGGRSPYTYTLFAGAGSVSAGGVFSPSGAGTATVSVTDSLGQVAYLPIEAVTATVNYDFMSAIPSGWGLTRNSTAYGQNSSNLLASFSSYTGRFEYQYNLGPIGLLIEPSSATNSLASAQALNSGWSPVSVVVTATSSVADPLNTYTAYSLTDDNSNGSNAGQLSYTTAKTATVSVFSVFAKADSASIVSLYSSVPASSCSAAVFDLVNGTSTNSSFCSSGSNNYGMIPYGNGWYRLWVRHTDTTGSNWNVMLFPAYHSVLNSSANITASGTAFFYGPQLEQGAYAPTSFMGTGSREADILNKASTEVPQYAGTVYTEWFNQATSLNQPGTIFLAGGLVANNHQIVRDTNNKALFSIYDTGTLIAQVTSPNTISLMSVNKAAYAYDGTNFYAGINGVITTTTSSGTLPLLPTGLNAGSDGSGGSFLNGHMRKITIWPKALSKEVLEQITQ